MSEFLIYFNERCLPIAFCDPAARSNGLKTMVATFERAMERQSGAKIAVLRDHWHGLNGELSLAEHIREAFSSDKTRYQRLLKKLRFLSPAELDASHEIHYEGMGAIGLGLADLTASKWVHGWALSYSENEEKWRKAKLPAERYVLDGSGNVLGPTQCEVCNLAEPDHVEAWDQQLRDWGETIAPSSVLGYIEGHPIVMYLAPLEHNPPHVHLRKSANHAGDIAKYRISDGVREKGLPTWDSEMKDWLAKYRDQLMKSWDRCQRGGYPYVLR